MYWNHSFFIRIFKKCYFFLKSTLINTLCVPIVEIWYNGFWDYRNNLISKGKDRTLIYDAYLERCSASIGVKSKFNSVPFTPHGLHGIHISDGAHIGRNVTIMQNVTIGSNTLDDSKRIGAPTILDNVFIGANASVIGNITIGNNCRIGANCCVFMDTADNQTIVMGGVRIINHLHRKENRFHYIKISDQNPEHNNATDV